MQGYDLDDTLAATKFEDAGLRGLVAVFRDAKVIYKPSQPFIVITARPHSTSALRTATENWLKENQPNYRGIYYVSGSEAEIIKAKARLIKEKRLTSFTDNNTNILAALKKETNITLYKMLASGVKKPY